MRYFAWDEMSKELIDPAMRDNYEYIELEYRKYIRDVLASKVSKNVVYIFETIIDEEEEDLKCMAALNDIYFGNSEDLEELENRSYFFHESIDISLKAYLSSLYLKN